MKKVLLAMNSAVPGRRESFARGRETKKKNPHTALPVGGFLPLILAGGGFWPPFAMSVAGGVFLSTVVSFFFTPQMFALLRPRKRTAEAMEPADPVAMAAYPRLAAE